MTKSNADLLMQYLDRMQMTPDEFARVIGVTNGAVRHWLNERRDIPELVMRVISFFEDYEMDIRELGDV